MKVEILTTQVDDVSGLSKRNGAPYHFQIQNGYLHLAGLKYPMAFRLMVPKTGRDENAEFHPYAPGVYSLSAESFSVDERGNLTVKPVLIPSKQAAAA